MSLTVLLSVIAFPLAGISSSPLTAPQAAGAIVGATYYELI